MTTSSAVQIYAVLFFKTTAADSGPRVGAVYLSDGTQVGDTFTFTGESASGWQTQLLPTPISLAAGASFVVAVNMNNYVTSSFPRTTSGPFSNIRSAYTYSAAISFPTNSQVVNRLIDFYYRLPVTISLAYTGSPQQYVVPAQKTALTVEACGGMGGDIDTTSNFGGLGGYMKAVVPVTPGQTLYIYVGQMGASGQASPRTVGAYNGGAKCNYANGGGGTDVRTADGGAAGSAALNSRVLVVGGGGGGRGTGWSSNYGGAGGGLVGQAGTAQNNELNGQGGSQTAGGAVASYNTACVNAGTGSGALWQGGACETNCFGGGGGYYGGGSGEWSGGGGSSYAHPMFTVIANNQGDARCNGNGWVTLTA